MKSNFEKLPQFLELFLFYQPTFSSLSWLCRTCLPFHFGHYSRIHLTFILCLLPGGWNWGFILSLRLVTIKVDFSKFHDWSQTLTSVLRSCKGEGQSSLPRARNVFLGHWVSCCGTVFLPAGWVAPLLLRADYIWSISFFSENRVNQGKSAGLQNAII